VCDEWLTLSLTHADLAGVTLSKLNVSSKIVEADITTHPEDVRHVYKYIYIYVCVYDEWLTLSLTHADLAGVTLAVRGG